MVMISRPDPAFISVAIHAEFHGFLRDIGHKKVCFRIHGFYHINGKTVIAFFDAVFKDKFNILCLGSLASDVCNPVLNVVYIVNLIFILFRPCKGFTAFAASGIDDSSAVLCQHPFSEAVFLFSFSSIGLKSPFWHCFSPFSLSFI